MDNQTMLKAILDIEATYYLRRSYWRYDFELYRLEEMGRKIFACGGSLSSPALCAQNKLVDELYLTACKNMGLLPIEF